VAQKFDELQFSEAMINKVIERVRVVYQAKKSNVSTQKKKLTSTKLNLEHKLETAEEKLIEGVIANDRFTALKIRYREQIDDIEEEIQKLERSRNLKIDVIQDILALMRDIGGAYRKASPELKRLYLGLFWQEFKAADRNLTEATKAPIVQALEAVGAITQKPAQLEQAFADLPTPSPLGEEVQIRTIRGPLQSTPREKQ
jgi:septation ring formation regulator EzrA